MDDVVGKNGLMQKLLKDVMQQLLEAERDEHLGRESMKEQRKTKIKIIHILYKNSSFQLVIGISSYYVTYFIFLMCLHKNLKPLQTSLEIYYFDMKKVVLNNLFLPSLYFEYVHNKKKYNHF